MIALEVREVRKRFGGIDALAGVSVSISRGEVLGVIGPNGSGKTTLVNVVSGFVRPDAGAVFLDGRDVTGHSPENIARRGLVRTFQTARPFRRLTAVESVVVPLCSPRARALADRGRFGDREAVALDLLEDVGFERDSPLPGQPAASLPQGYLRRLELARCLAAGPTVIVTDELFSGLSPAEVASLVPLLRKLAEGGVTLVLVEHRLRELFALAQRVLVLDEGRPVALGAPEDVAADPAVRETYLGREW